MMMLEETLPVPTPTRFVMEAIPEFSTLSEVNPFEFSFTKNFSSVLPPTPGASFLKTPDPFSIFKYITTPVPQIFTPATPPLSEKDHSDTPTDKQNKDQDGESATQAISGRNDGSQELPKLPSPSPSPSDVHIPNSTNDPPQTTIKKEDPMALDQSKFQANDSILNSSPSNKSPRKQSMASNEWMEYERFSRAGSVDSDMSSTSSLGQKRKASMSDDLEDPEAKRKRFLERNRMAASKCRQKKKMWMQELEQRADDVQQRNKALNTLVSQLKEEVLILKSQLLSHHNCNCNLIQQYVQTSGHFMSMMNNLHTQAPSMSQPMNNLHHTHPSLPLHPPHHSQHPCHTEHSHYPQTQHIAPSREIMYAR